MFFLVWGTKGRAKLLNSGAFYCPDCVGQCSYNHMSVRKWFTLYWIPLIPMGDLGEYIECQTCKGTFNARVLEFDPQADQEKFEAAFSVAAKRVMFRMALADGEIDEAEIDEITTIFQNIAKREIDRGDIAAEIEAAREDTREIADYLKEVAPSMNDHGKELVLRSAIAVAKADGNIDASELSELRKLAVALELPPAYAKGVFVDEGVAIAS